ncbi:MAG: hypothetical protein KFB93_04930 [Simkaniaceae bacterium]|nr:MAG: hypothetical protein KFB93_04930 [Simkaniaceae bacterium]
MKRTIYYYSRPFMGGIREGLFIRLKSETGRVGWGEVAPLPGFSKETLEEALEDLIEGNDSFYPSVQWGLASAMLDLMYPIEVDAIPVRVLEKEKIKVGHLTLKEAIEKVSASHCSGVDMNQQWKLKEALAFAKHFPKLDYFEEPLKPGEEAEAFPYPVALDESLRKRIIPSYPSIKMHIIKPMLHGYPLPKKVKGVDFILSSSYESELGIYQLAKLSFRLKLPLKPMGLGTCHLFEEPLFEEEPYYKNGFLHFPKEWRLKMDKIQVILDECI